MISRTLLTLALRSRLLETEVCTTGATSIAATTTGYTRAAGSFVDDEFAVGMELLASGFATAANNGYKVIRSVEAGTLLVDSLTTMEAEAAGGNETLTVGIPEGRAFDNLRFQPTGKRPYIEEDIVPATSRVVTFPANTGYAEDTGLYVIKWFGLSDTDMLDLGRCSDAVLARFSGGTSFSLSDGTTVRIPTQTGPYAGQITPVAGGWSYVAITVPYLADSINAVAA